MPDLSQTAAHAFETFAALDYTREQKRDPEFGTLPLAAAVGFRLPATDTLPRCADRVPGGTVKRKAPESQSGRQSKRLQAETQFGPGIAPRLDAVLETQFD
jgi:hypothetical protein